MHFNLLSYLLGAHRPLTWDDGGENKADFSSLSGFSGELIS